MATPRTVTVGQLYAASGGRSCKPIMLLMETFLPGYTEDTTCDLLTYMEFMRDNGQAANVCVGAFGGMTTAERGQFIAYALNQIISHTPAGYARRAAMIQLRLNLIDYVQTPTAPKRAALLATAKAIKPNPENDAEMHVANAFKGIVNMVANNTLTYHNLSELAYDLAKAGEKLGGVTKATVYGAMLTRIQEIMNLV